MGWLLLILGLIIGAWFIMTEFWLILACVLVFFLSGFIFVLVSGEHQGFFENIFDTLMLMVCSILSVIVLLVLKFAFEIEIWLAILLSIGAAIIFAFATKMIVAIWKNIT
jgi:hypothetical protein